MALEVEVMARGTSTRRHNAVVGFRFFGRGRTRNRGKAGERCLAQDPSTGPFDVAQDGVMVNGLGVDGWADLWREAYCVRPFDKLRVNGLGERASGENYPGCDGGIRLVAGPLTG